MARNKSALAVTGLLVDDPEFDGHEIEQVTFTMALISPSAGDVFVIVTGDKKLLDVCRGLFMGALVYIEAKSLEIIDNAIVVSPMIIRSV